jgi:hypothetical protein
MKNVIVFDIDGTLANCDHRLHYLERVPQDWEGFCNPIEVVKDVVIADVARIYRAMTPIKWEFVLCTGREETSREATHAWLWRNNLPFDRLLMRAEGDFRHDTQVKPELLSRAGCRPDNVIAIFEDRSCVVDKWRELGYTCFQVAKGDY